HYIKFHSLAFMNNRFFIPINYHFRRFKEYTQRYLHTGMNREGAQKKILWELFVIVNEFLQTLEIDYWANFGTLLGFFREEGIIGHDIDIDFGCDEKLYSYIWENRHRLNKNVSMHDTSHRHHGPKLYFSYKGFDADIYFYQNNGEKLHT